MLDDMNDINGATKDTSVLTATALQGNDKARTVFDALMATPEAKLALQALPGHYTLYPQGIEMQTADAKGNPVTLWLGAPLLVIGQARTSDSNDWCKVVRFLDQDLAERQLVLADADLHTGTGVAIKQLVQCGLHVSADKPSHDGLVNLLRTWKPTERYRLVSRLGWTDRNSSAFVLGDGSVIGDDKVLPRPHLSAFLNGKDHTKGTLQMWKTKISPLCRSNPLMMTAVSHSFCGPLLEPLGMEGGGLHFRGAPSSGKSTLLRLANSVWGKSTVLRTWNGTKNALETIAASHSGRLLALDEIGEADPRTVGDTAYALANGQGRARLSASLTRRDLDWRLAVLSSGEVSLAEHMAGAGKTAKAGQEVRLLDIPTDMETRGVFLELHGHPDTRAFAHDLNTVLEHAFGTAGPAFVDKLIPCLVPNLENFQKHLTNFNKKARATLDLPEDGVTARALKRFGLISLAGELATGFEITGWDNGEATDAAIETLRLWVLGHDLPTDDDVSSSVRRLAGYVAANQNRFMALDTASAQLPQAFVGWVDQTRYYFTADAWAEAHRGHDLIDVGHQLQSRQLLATNDSGLKWRLPRRFTGRPRCYAVWRAGVDSTAPVSTAA